MIKYLVYLLTILIVGSAVAQNPTILQGNYITNVFGNANFVKNPNALVVGSSTTTNPFVTTNAATITRVTTTPLIATSKFTMTTSTNAGYADWEFRAFDAGMKYQICELRFMYKGFSVGTTTAQVISGASTVIASQVLNPATDPQTVSIVFNCGDLSQTTKFRLQQSGSILTGTNEIGAIYAGLATNMSVIAQATKVGGWDNVSCSQEAQLTTGTAWATPNVAGVCTGTAVGSASSALSNLNTLTFTFTGLLPGEYLLLMPAYVYTQAVANARCDGRIRETTLNYVDGQNAFSSYQSTAPTQFGSIGQINQFKFTNTVTATRTFQIEFWRQSGNATCLGGFIGQSGGVNSYQNVSLYRFPTASEQVLTPNITSTWGAIKYSGVSDFTGTSTTAGTNVTNTNFGTATLFGKADLPGANCGLATSTFGFCMYNVPPGTYKIGGNVEVGVLEAGTDKSWCNYQLQVAGSSLAAQNVVQVIPHSYAWNQFSPLGTGFVKIDSFQSYVQIALTYNKETLADSCNVRSSTSNTAPAQPALFMEPIDSLPNLPIFIDQTPYTVTATSLTAPVAPYGRFEASGAGTTITLFGCTAATKGYNVEVKRVDASNNITVSRSGTDTIDGATTDLLAVNYQATQYVCNGSGGWRRF